LFLNKVREGFVAPGRWWAQTDCSHKKLTDLELFFATSWVLGLCPDLMTRPKRVVRRVVGRDTRPWVNADKNLERRQPSQQNPHASASHQNTRVSCGHNLCVVSCQPPRPDGGLPVNRHSKSPIDGTRADRTTSGPDDLDSVRARRGVPKTRQYAASQLLSSRVPCVRCLFHANKFSKDLWE